MSIKPPCGPLRADKEVLPKHVYVGKPLWIEGENGKWYSAEDGSEVEVVTMSLEELLKKLSDDR